MKQTLISLFLVIISLLGIFDAGYVTYETLSGQIPVCRPPFQCAEVLESEWAYIAGLPVSVYGLGFYVVMFILSVTNFLGASITIPVVGSIKRAIKWATTFGFLFSLYLVILMAFVIKAWCLWCLISATSAILLFVISRFLSLNETLDPGTEKIS